MAEGAPAFNWDTARRDMPGHLGHHASPLQVTDSAVGHQSWGDDALRCWLAVRHGLRSWKLPWMGNPAGGCH